MKQTIDIWTASLFIALLSLLHSSSVSISELCNKESCYIPTDQNLQLHAALYTDELQAIVEARCFTLLFNKSFRVIVLQLLVFEPDYV